LTAIPYKNWDPGFQGPGLSCIQIKIREFFNCPACLTSLSATIYNVLLLLNTENNLLSDQPSFLLQQNEMIFNVLWHLFS